MTMTIEKNTVEIHFLDSEQFKTNIIAVLFRIPLTRQNVTKTALLAEVLKNGCTAYPSQKAISQKMDDMFGSVFDISILKKGQEQVLFFYLETIKYKKELMEEAFHFLNHVIFSPLQQGKGFIKEIVEREKKVLAEKIKSRQDDKKEYAKLRCLEEMCKQNAFGIFADGYEQDLKDIDEVTLLMHYKNILKHAKIELFLTGEKQQKNSIMNYAQKLPFQSNFLWQADPILIPPKKEVQTVKESLAIAQSRIVLGFYTHVLPEKKEFASLLVCNELFGGGPSSLLFQNVREKEGACYDISSFLFRLYPILMVKAGIQQQHSEKVVHIIKDCLKQLQREKIEQKILQEAKENIIKYYASMKDSQTAWIDFSYNEWVLKTNRTIEQFIHEIEQVSQQDVQKRANDISLDTIYLLEKLERGEKNGNEKRK